MHCSYKQQISAITLFFIIQLLLLLLLLICCCYCPATATPSSTIGCISLPGCSVCLLTHCCLKNPTSQGTVHLYPSLPPYCHSRDSSFRNGHLRVPSKVAQGPWAAAPLWHSSEGARLTVCCVHMRPFLFHHRVFNGLLEGLHHGLLVRCHAVLHWKSAFCC